MSKSCIKGLKNDESIKTLYRDMREDILSMVKSEAAGKMSSDDVWEIVIREGLFQNLSEHPSVSLSILAITPYGPDREYMDYLNIVNDYSDLLAMVALSALVNDVIHYKPDSSIDRID